MSPARSVFCFDRCSLGSGCRSLRGGGARFAPASGRHIYGEEFMWCKEFPTLQLVFFLLLYINDGLFYIWYFISSVLIVLELLFCVGDYSSLEDVWVLVVRL